MSDVDVLRRRAERLARRVAGTESGTLFSRVAVVEIGGQRFGIPVEGVREIVPLPPVTPIPTSSRGLLGIVQVRGALLGVVDLAEWLGVAREEMRWLAVLVDGSRSFGLAVTAVHDFRDVHREDLADSLRSAGSGRRIVLAVTHDFVTLLDVKELAAISDAAAPPETDPTPRRSPQ